MKVAEQVLVANAVTNGLFNSNLRQFVTGKTPSGGYGSMYQPTDKDNVLTLPEMLGIDRQRKLMTNTKGQQLWTSGVMVDPGLQFENIKSNLMTNGMSMVGQVIAIPLVFRFGKKFLAKPLINPANKLIRMAGVKEVKV